MFETIGRYEKTGKISLKQKKNPEWEPCQVCDGRDAILFTGEIYNLGDLKSDLKIGGESIDAPEILLRYFKKYGIDRLLSKLNGIFAIAIFASADTTLYLIRDHTGIYPLYYFEQPEWILFSSEVKMFLENGVSARLSYEGVFSYLANQSAQEPFTLIDGIKALGPGELLKYSDRGIDIKAYWNPADCTLSHSKQYDSFDAAGKNLCDLLHKAISVRKNSGHRTGILLSGGIDSSAIVAISRLLNNNEEIHTFTVTHDNPAFDEREFARLVAKKNKTIEHELHISNEMIGQCIFEALETADQPSVDGVNTYFSSKLIKENGFDSVVSGLGGEFFVEDDATAFLRIKKKYNYLSHIPSIAATMIDNHTDNKRIRYASMLIKSEDAFFAYLRLLSDGQIKRIVSRDVYNKHKDELDSWHKIAYKHLVREAAKLPDDIAKKYFYESRTLHVSTWLKDVMQNSIKQGVMPQFPLMDYRLIEYLFNLPISAKADYKTSKVHLVNAAEGNIPAECVYRKKLGFVFPFFEYFKVSMRSEMERFFLGGYSSEFFDKDNLKRVWKSFLEGEENWAVIWKLFVLDRWITNNHIIL